LQVLDKHVRIEELCSQLNNTKNSFIECTRIANEIRVQKMSAMNSPQKTAKSSKGSPTKRDSLIPTQV
jgi:hypothetical protein